MKIYHNLFQHVFYNNYLGLHILYCGSVCFWILIRGSENKCGILLPLFLIWLIEVAIFSHTRFSSFNIPSTLKYGPSFAFLGNLESISEFKGLQFVKREKTSQSSCNWKQKGSFRQSSHYIYRRYHELLAVPV